MTGKALKNLESSKSHSGISVISLDALKPTEKLIPGEPCEIASGVTISVMQSAAEALVEIQEQAAGTISIDNHPASELTTVKPGQIIKTVEGRYVLIRHLQAMIVPRGLGYERPDHVEKMIELAVASLQSAVRAEETVAKEAVMSAHVDAAPLSINPRAAGQPASRKRSIRLAVLGSAAVGVIALCFLPGNKDDSANVSNNAKSRVIAAVERSQEIAPKAEAVVSPKDETKNAVAEKQPEPKPVQEHRVSAVEALRSAAAPVTAPDLRKLNPRYKPQVAEADGESAVAAQNSRQVKLSEKDRQTIVEYKLEAKFDRSKVRIKLKDMAKTFPAGSPARAEVEKALNGI